MDQEQIQLIASAIEKQGYIVLPSAVSSELQGSLNTRIRSFQESELKSAGIGRGNLKQSNRDIRRDKIQWLDKQNITDNRFLMVMESLRIGLNQSLFLGLFDYESHYAIYQEGDFYKQHVDALKGSSNRVLSTVYYLNENWNDDDGGEIILYDIDGETILETINPRAGTMVIFLSEQFPHEVRVAKTTRYSIAGWFRVNASGSQRVDTVK